MVMGKTEIKMKWIINCNKIKEVIVFNYDANSKATNEIIVKIRRYKNLIEDKFFIKTRANIVIISLSIFLHFYEENTANYIARYANLRK